MLAHKAITANDKEVHALGALGALGVHDVCRTKVGEFFSFLCPLQSQ